MILITAIAIIIRSIPAWIYSGWGNDFGIYYSVTIEFLAKKNPFLEYPAPWGSSGYGVFPMLYIIILFVQYLTGISPNVLLLKIPPVIGGLTVIPLYFISYELTKKRGTSLVAASLLAINPVHVYQTSMPYFLTIGHFFLLLSIYFFIKWQKNEKYLIYLIISSIALLLSHHLTNYIFIISIIGISLVLSLFRKIPREKMRRNFIFISSFSALTFAYWITRVPGMIDFMEAPFKFLIPWYIEILSFFIFLLVIFFISVKFEIRRNQKIETFLEEIKIRYVFSFSLGLGIITFILLAIFGLKGYYIPFISIIYSIPFLLTMGFVGAGLSRLYKNENILYIIGGWIGAIFLSLIIGIITWSSIEPWRHVEYLMEPLSIVGAIGISEILKSDSFKKVSIKKRIKVTLKSPILVMTHHFSQDLNMGMPSMLRIGNGEPAHEPFEYKTIFQVGKNMEIAFISIFIFIILMSGIMAFPFMNQIEVPPKQEVSFVVMSGINWIAENGNLNYTVATDHKIGTILAAYGFNSSFEYDYKIWNSTSWKDCIWELKGLNGTYPKIGYVIISRDMKESGVYGYGEIQNPMAPPVIISNESYEKFKHEPFELVFSNTSLNGNDWVEVYRVNWTYIYKNMKYGVSLKNNEKISPEKLFSILLYKRDKISCG